jgi:hypothetical protein
MERAGILTATFEETVSRVGQSGRKPRETFGN